MKADFTSTEDGAQGAKYKKTPPHPPKKPQTNPVESGFLSGYKSTPDSRNLDVFSLFSKVSTEKANIL